MAHSSRSILYRGDILLITVYSPYGLNHLSYHETVVEYDVHVAFQNTTPQPPITILCSSYESLFGVAEFLQFTTEFLRGKVSRYAFILVT